MPQNSNIFKRIDWVIVSIFLFLVLAGWVNIYSAVFNEEHVSIFDMTQRYGKQLVWIGFAIVLAVFIMAVDSNFFVTFAIPIYGFFILLLLVVLAVGHEVNGSKSWIEIGSFALQPAEFAKLGTSLAVAKLLSSFSFKMGEFKSMAMLVGVILLPVLLIFLQNDTGSALVYSVFVLMLFREGLSGLVLFFALLVAIIFIVSLMFSPLVTIISLVVLSLIALYVLRRKVQEVVIGTLTWLGLGLFLWLVRYLITGVSGDLYPIALMTTVVVAVVFLTLSLLRRIPHIPLVIMVLLATLAFSFTVDLVFDNVLASHQQDRILDLLGIHSDPLGAGYNVNQSKIAIGSGGFLGKGFLKGTQTKFNFVPEQSTDFIFCTVGEEWGFVGSLFVIAVFVFLMIRIVNLAERQKSVFSRVYGYCVASIFFFHFVVNIGMTIGLMPVIGIPLPFFSYGGSSLWFFTMLLFVFLRLDASRFEQLR